MPLLLDVSALWNPSQAILRRGDLLLFHILPLTVIITVLNNGLHGFTYYCEYYSYNGFQCYSI